MKTNEKIKKIQSKDITYTINNVKHHTHDRKTKQEHKNTQENLHLQEIEEETFKTDRINKAAIEAKSSMSTNTATQKQPQLKTQEKKLYQVLLEEFTMKNTGKSCILHKDMYKNLP